MKKQISAEVIADSVNEHGNRITSFVVTFPRIVLAEFNTHRMFSRNSASSRAIPFKRMLKMVKEDPFIPIAFQKDHSGMQGTEYLDANRKIGFHDFVKQLNSLFSETDDFADYSDFVNNLQYSYGFENGAEYTCIEWWLIARDKAVEAAIMLACFGVTKQLCNRLLEPFMWHTVIVTATQYENFFHLRCPQYEVNNKVFRSRKDFKDQLFTPLMKEVDEKSPRTEVEWLSLNQGGAEIHAARLAECMWDAYNESIPKQLKAGEWHIPFGDKIDEGRVIDFLSEEFGSDPNYYGKEGQKAIQDTNIQIATARCARVSYMNYEGKDDYEADIKLYERLSDAGHASPFEHCAQAMSDIEVKSNTGLDREGWSGNFQGWIQLRKILEQRRIINTL